MTHQVPARKPLDSDAFFKTLRGLHPSKKQLDDIAVVEQKFLRDRLAVKDAVPVRVIKGPKSVTGVVKNPHGKGSSSSKNIK